MINHSRKSNIDCLYEDSNQLEDFLSLINTEPLSSKYYLNIQSHRPSTYGHGINNNYNNNIHSFHCSQEKNDFPQNRNNYPIKIPKPNTTINNNNFINEFSFWDKKLSDLSINKYKKMRENNNFQTIQNDINTFRNNFLINYTHSINNSIDKDNTYNNINRTNDYFINKINNHENIETIDNENIKVKKNKNLKNKIRLNKEIINYKKLEQKINNEIENKNKEKKLKKYKKNYYNSNKNPIINFNNDEIKNKNNKKLNDFLPNNIKISKKNSHKKLKRKKGDEDDISNSQNETIKRNTTFTYKDKDIDENINSTFIKYLKKDNNKLIHINTIYKQLIDSFFYFINQLSKKYDFKNEIKDINYYLSNANDLSNILIDLEQHLNKLFKSNEINKKKDEINTHIISNSFVPTIDFDKEEELLNKSKFITINTDNRIKKIENPFSTRNSYGYKKFFTQTNKSLQNNSINYFNNSNLNERNISEKNRRFKKVIKIKKNNGKLIKVMNKVNFGFFSPKQKNIQNKIILKKNNKINNDSIKNSESNDLKSIINPKYLKETNNYKYIN